ncbi:MAG: hypothetical protein QOJ70_2072 [Acidobacteriota bacterium]|jgi:hypothetical protein|nr:hypothetical protein [Acidobacteriota bacterium]
MSDCKTYLREIEEEFEQSVPNGVARTHAASCRACGDALRERESLLSLVRGLGKVEAPADFEFRLRARMASAKTVGRRGPFGGLRAAYGFAPAAVALCFVIVSASLYLRQPARTNPASRPGAGVQEVASNTLGPQSHVSDINPVTRVANSGGAPLSIDAPRSTVNISRPVVQKQRIAQRVRMPAQKSLGVGAEPALSTTVASLNSAEVIRSHTMSIPLETAAAPLRLVLRDERGAERVVPMRAVSFGAQDLIAREGGLRQTTAAHDEGVW